MPKLLVFLIYKKYQRNSIFQQCKFYQKLAKFLLAHSKFTAVRQNPQRTPFHFSTLRRELGSVQFFSIPSTSSSTLAILTPPCVAWVSPRAFRPLTVMLQALTGEILYYKHTSHSASTQSPPLLASSDEYRMFSQNSAPSTLQEIPQTQIQLVLLRHS